MALKFRLRGLAETLIEQLECPICGVQDSDETLFNTDNTRVTLEGIIVVAECRGCGELFVPQGQRLGVIDEDELRRAVLKDCADSGEPLLESLIAVELSVEALKAMRRGEIH